MNLQEFIRETLTQIAAGVSEADAALKDKGGSVSPKDMIASYDRGVLVAQFIPNMTESNGIRPIEMIEFDVVVTASEATEAKGGGGLHVGAITVGGAKKAESGNSSESRVKFKVPMLLPVSKHT